MARITYTYKSYPNCPRATEYSHGREQTTTLLSGITGFASLFVVIAFFIYTFSLFSEGDFENFFYASLYTIVVAFWDAYIFVLRDNNTECNLKIILLKSSSENKQFAEVIAKQMKKENRKENWIFLKKYCLYFLWGMLTAIFLVGLIQGFIDSASELIFSSLLALFLLAIILFLTLPRGRDFIKRLTSKKKKQKITPVKEENNITNEMEEKLFCRKCGTQILLDSLYCNKCGTKVETL